MRPRDVSGDEQVFLSSLMQHTYLMKIQGGLNVMDLWAVVPAQNEEATIEHVITTCLSAGSTRIVVVLNGCTDNTEKVVAGFPSSSVLCYRVQEPLGLDIPRCIGAYIAYMLGASYILFCDGDLSGNISGHLSSLYGSMAWGYDLALSDCYPRGIPGTGLAGQVVAHRVKMNRTIGRGDLGAAIMSHGPSCISRRFLETLPVEVLGIPPLAQALSVKTGLTVKIGSSIAHEYLGSRERHGEHPNGIAELIIGDCIAAESVFSGGPPLRCDPQGVPHIGLDRFRRWDLLEQHLVKLRHSFYSSSSLTVYPTAWTSLT